MQTPTELRITVIGDELTAGIGDPKGLGWLGRVSARTPSDTPMVMLPLPVPGETTTELSNRWQEEFNRRVSASPLVEHRLVIGLGHADISSNLSIARSRLNLANILDVAAERRIPTFIVGPPPTIPEQAGAIGELSAAFADVAHRRRIPYVDTFTPLVDHEQWSTDIATTPGAYPSQAGYGLMAWLVLHTGWFQWLGLSQD